MSTTYGRGHAAGYAAAVDRETSGDATNATDGSTWFVMPADEDGPAADYERGFVAGFADYFEGRRA